MNTYTQFCSARHLFPVHNDPKYIDKKKSALGRRLKKKSIGLADNSFQCIRSIRDCRSRVGMSSETEAAPPTSSWRDFLGADSGSLETDECLLLYKYNMGTRPKNRNSTGEKKFCDILSGFFYGLSSNSAEVEFWSSSFRNQQNEYQLCTGVDVISSEIDGLVSKLDTIV